MDAGAPQYSPRTVEEVFQDYKARRTALVKALTTDVDEFFQQCDPEKENLCLYGHPNGQWEVSLPAEEVPPEIPEPALGINFARDGMQEKDWLALVAVHSDAWLLAVAFYFGARFGFDKTDRNRLFGMINELPTVYEVVNGKNKARTAYNNHSHNKSDSNSKVVNDIFLPKLLQKTQYYIFGVFTCIPPSCYVIINKTPNSLILRAYHSNLFFLSKEPPPSALSPSSFAVSFPPVPSRSRHRRPSASLISRSRNPHPTKPRLLPSCTGNVRRRLPPSCIIPLRDLSPQTTSSLGQCCLRIRLQGLRNRGFS